MRSIWVIANRELLTFFNSLIAYILFIVFLGFSGFYTWFSGENVFVVGQADLHSFFTISYWSLFFFIPAITMRTIAEENKTGTISLLVTKPITDWQVVLGKFLSCLVLIGIALVLTMPYYITILYLGDVDSGAVMGGYLGLLLMSIVYISIGVFSSSITNNQIVAFLIALFISAFFHLVFDQFTLLVSGFPSLLFAYFSLGTHFESISRGVIDVRDVFYFITLGAIALYAAQIRLSRRNWYN